MARSVLIVGADIGGLSAGAPGVSPAAAMLRTQ